MNCKICDSTWTLGEKISEKDLCISCLQRREYRMPIEFITLPDWKKGYVCSCCMLLWGKNPAKHVHAKLDKEKRKRQKLEEKQKQYIEHYYAPRKIFEQIVGEFFKFNINI